MPQCAAVSDSADALTAHARCLNREVQQIQSRLFVGPKTPGDVCAELVRLLVECGENWGGMDEEPIKPGAINEALRLVERLPSGVSMPEVLPEPDGDVALSWYFESSDELILSFTDSGRVAYCATISGGTTHGMVEPEERDSKLASLVLALHDEAPK